MNDVLGLRLYLQRGWRRAGDGSTESDTAVENVAWLGRGIGVAHQDANFT